MRHQLREKERERETLNLDLLLKGVLIILLLVILKRSRGSMRTTDKRSGIQDPDIELRNVKVALWR